MDPQSLSGLAPFIAVAETNSFTAAAARLGVTPTAVSKAVRALEKRHGVSLFQRTTRRVALTEAGEAIFSRLQPAVVEITDALAALGEYSDRPRGTLRVTAPRNTADFFHMLVPKFRKAYPDVALELSLDDALIDLVAAGYDAGVRLGDAVAKDMVAVRLTPEVTWSIVGAPAYLEKMGRPKTPEDLIHHEAIQYRFPTSQAVHRWGFRRGSRDYVVDVKGGLIVNDRSLVVEFAVKGLGLAFVSDREAAPHVAAGRLEPLLQTWIPGDSGIFLYFPERSRDQQKLKVFVDTAKAVARVWSV